MRRVLTGALLAAVLAACSVEAPEYRPTPNPSPTVAAKPDILPLMYEVDPLSVRAGTVVAVSKTAIFFSILHAFVLDWFLTVRFKSAVGVIGCKLNVATTATVPGFSKLHLVIIVRSKASSRDVLGALQWRPEIAANAKPWLSLGAGEMLKIEMHDGYPAPTVPWEYEVFAHAYQYSSQ